MSGQTKLMLLLALLGAAGFVMVGGDVLPENDAERHDTMAMRVLPRSHEARNAVSAPYQDCQRIVRGRQLRWQVAHFGDVEKLRIDCSYEERGELQL